MQVPFTFVPSFNANKQSHKCSSILLAGSCGPESLQYVDKLLLLPACRQIPVKMETMSWPSHLTVMYVETWQ